MKRIIAFTILLFGTMLSSSCSIFRLTNDYKKLPVEWTNIVVPLESFDKASRGNITKINGAQLREELKKHPKAIVYIINNHRQEIVSLRRFEESAMRQGYKLFLVMDGYSYISATFNQHMYSSVFVIDNAFYGKKFTDTYVRIFVNDLIDRDRSTSLNSDFLYYFENGKMIFSKDSYSYE